MVHSALGSSEVAQTLDTARNFGAGLLAAENGGSPSLPNAQHLFLVLDGVVVRAGVCKKLVSNQLVSVEFRIIVIRRL